MPGLMTGDGNFPIANPSTGNPFGASGAQPGMMDKLKEFGASPLGQMLKAALDGAAKGVAMTPVSANAPGGLQAMGGAWTAVGDAERKKAALALAKKRQAALDGLKFNKDRREEDKLGLAGDRLALDRKDQKRKQSETNVRNQAAVEKLMGIRPDGSLSASTKIKLQDQLAEARHRNQPARNYVGQGSQ
jgi:hypothetical protein